MERRSGTRYKEVLREEEAIYIPLLNSLEQLLNKTSILQEVSLLTQDVFSFLKHRNSEPHPTPWAHQQSSLPGCCAF